MEGRWWSPTESMVHDGGVLNPQQVHIDLNTQTFLQIEQERDQAKGTILLDETSYLDRDDQHGVF